MKITSRQMPIDRRRFLKYAAGAGAMASLGGSVFARGLNQAPTAAGDSRLPDGTSYAAWERPLTFSKTYYVDTSAAAADDNGPGTRSRPFRTINKAAQMLQPGERVVIAAGIYRECVRPARGGASPAEMISYEAAPGAKVFIKGSEVLKDGWVRVSSPLGGRGVGVPAGATQPPIATWRHEFTGAMFPDGYQPFALPSIMGSWSWLDPRAVDMGRFFAGADWCSSTASRRAVEQQRELTRRVCSPSPTSRYPPSPRTACRRVVGAGRPCRRSAARPICASGWSRRDRRFSCVWLRARRRTTRSK
jgi:hypothetical protein